MTFSLEEHVARAIRRNKFERLKIGKACDPGVEPSESEVLDARAAIAAVREREGVLAPDHAPASGNWVAEVFKPLPPEEAAALREILGDGCDQEPTPDPAEAMRHVTADESRILHRALLASSKIVDHGTDPAEAMRDDAEGWRLYHIEKAKDGDVWKQRAMQAAELLSLRTEAMRAALMTFATFGLVDPMDAAGEDMLYGLMRDRICDWFGPSDFHAARAALKGNGEGR